MGLPSLTLDLESGTKFFGRFLPCVTMCTSVPVSFAVESLQLNRFVFWWDSDSVSLSTGSAHCAKARRDPNADGWSVVSMIGSMSSGCSAACVVKPDFLRWRTACNELILC